MARAVVDSEKCSPINYVRGGMWWAFLFVAIVLIALTGLLAGLTLSVMSVDRAKLKVLNETGDSKQKKHAALILQVRNRPNWLLTSLVLASVMVAEGLPLVLDRLFKPSSYGAFVISSLAVALAGEIIPQSIMPLYVLEFGGACIWFVKFTMWLMAPIAFPLAYALRLFKVWQTRKQPNKLDGLLQMNELVEFIRLHEQCEKHGGMLVNEAGLIARTCVENHEGTIGENIRPFAAVMILRATTLISPIILGNIKSWAVSYLLVVRDGTMENRATQQDDVEVDATVSIFDFMGVLLVKELVGSNVRRDSDHSETIGDFPIRRVPIVQSNCSIYRVIALLAEGDHSCALVVSPFLDSKVDDITPHLVKFGSVISESLYLQGIIDYHDLVSRVLFGRLSEHHSRQANDYESARGSCHRTTSMPSPDNGTVIRRRLAPSFGTLEVDDLGHETDPVQPRVLSLGWRVPTRKMFEGFSISTGGRISKPRLSLFWYFGKHAT
ncbi:hypothetical protein MMC07_003271 [Pseudocyphellaria aurata]|nr:hypothetical protein [Pseudocyphellaria aurata]